MLPSTSVESTYMMGTTKTFRLGPSCQKRESSFDRSFLFPEQAVSASDLVIGTILGDGYISKRGVLTIEHSLSSEPYVTWKYLVMKEAGLLTPRCQPRAVKRCRKSMQTCQALFSRRVSNHTEVSSLRDFWRVTRSLRFNTRTLYAKERGAFYENNTGRKRIPINFHLLLSAPALAVWFMDDGGKGGNSRDGMVLDVTGFSEKEKVLIQQVLRNKFLISTTIQQSSPNSRHNSAKIFVLKSSALHFRKLISPFLVPTMRYKIGTSAPRKDLEKKESC